jgi:hypothetical protein
VVQEMGSHTAGVIADEVQIRPRKNWEGLAAIPHPNEVVGMSVQEMESLMPRIVLKETQECPKSRFRTHDRSI